MRPYLTPIAAILLFFALSACRERYDLQIEPNLYRLLVVEGNILQGDTTVIHLSRTTEVSEDGLSPETGATLMVESSDNNRYPSTETEPGVYKIGPLNLVPSNKYRLLISSGDKGYESDWVSVINTPEIDSLYWTRNNGVEILVQSSGEQDDTKYYKFDYDEVWDFYSMTTSHIYYNFTPHLEGYLTCDTVEVDGVKYEKCLEQYIWSGYNFNDSMYHCWKYNTNGAIHLGATTTLSENSILASVRKIENNGFELSNLYSILVKQTGLSKECYEFYQVLKRNTESMGSIFDAQPSQLKTNFRCVTNPEERVIGFIDATTIKTKRLFISHDQLDGWDYSPYASCAFTFDTIFDTSPLNISRLIQNDIVPISPLYSPEPPAYVVGAFTVMSKFCMDCRERGVHRKPDFWPY